MEREKNKGPFNPPGHCEECGGHKFHRTAGIRPCTCPKVESSSNKEPLISEIEVKNLIDMESEELKSDNSIDKGYYLGWREGAYWLYQKLISKLPQRDKPLTGTTCDEPILSVERDKSAETELQCPKCGNKGITTVANGTFPDEYKCSCGLEWVEEYASQNKGEVEK